MLLEKAKYLSPNWLKVCIVTCRQSQACWVDGILIIMYQQHSHSFPMFSFFSTFSPPLLSTHIHSVTEFRQGKVEFKYIHNYTFWSQQSLIKKDVSNTLFPPHWKSQQVMHKYIFIFSGLPPCTSYDKGFLQAKCREEKFLILIFLTAKMGFFQTWTKNFKLMNLSH